MSTWVFGYGSLVSFESLGGTLGRPVHRDDGWCEAVVHGWGRRWNYGVGLGPARWLGADGREVVLTAVALGVVASPSESVNGVVVRVTDDELARLDRRERHYDRVDVTGHVDAGGAVDGPVVTYVPRPEAVAGYERARDQRAAAIEQRYWDLVHGAFLALGADRLDRYLASTPRPDVPVLDVRRP